MGQQSYAQGSPYSQQYAGENPRFQLKEGKKLWPRSHDDQLFRGPHAELKTRAVKGKIQPGTKKPRVGFMDKKLSGPGFEGRTVPASTHTVHSGPLCTVWPIVHSMCLNLVTYCAQYVTKLRHILCTLCGCQVTVSSSHDCFLLSSVIRLLCVCVSPSSFLLPLQF